jgi:hypothetical protein
MSLLIARISENWMAFVNSQGTGFTLNEFNEELFAGLSFINLTLKSTLYFSVHLPWAACFLVVVVMGFNRLALGLHLMMTSHRGGALINAALPDTGFVCRSR